jgi:hypothetical protein
VVALALAPGANREIRASAGSLTGDGMVKTGVICGWISVALTALGLVLLVVFIITEDSSTSAVGAPGRTVLDSGAGLLALAGVLPQWRRLRGSRARRCVTPIRAEEYR